MASGSNGGGFTKVQARNGGFTAATKRRAKLKKRNEGNSTL